MILVIDFGYSLTLTKLNIEQLVIWLASQISWHIQYDKIVNNTHNNGQTIITPKAQTGLNLEEAKKDIKISPVYKLRTAKTIIRFNNDGAAIFKTQQF